MTKEQHQEFIEFALDLKWNRDDYSRARIIEELMVKVDELVTKQNKDLSLNIISLSLQELEKIKRISYLKGVTGYTMWADYFPNGNDICDKYQEELRNLLSDKT